MISTFFKENFRENLTFHELREKNIQNSENSDLSKSIEGGAFFMPDAYLRKYGTSI